MNYRRGFQRVYAVVALAWITAALFMTPSTRFRFWETDIDYAAVARQAGAIAYEGPSPESRIHKILWLAGVLFLSPALGYVVLFLMLPWIYRGFNPGVDK